MTTDYIAPLHIDVLCDSNLVGNRDVAFAVEACRLQLIDAAKAWGIEPPGMAIYDRNGYVPSDAGTAIIHLINSDGDASSLGSHEDIGGIPVGVVDMAQSGAEWSTVLSHEALEILGNAQLDRWVDGPGGLSFAVELGDPVQANTYAVEVGILGELRAVDVSAFVKPAWFGLENADGSKGVAKGSGFMPMDPFQIADGGYQIAADAAGNIRYLAAEGGAMFPARKLRSTSRTARLIAKGRAR